MIAGGKKANNNKTKTNNNNHRETVNPAETSGTRARNEMV
jgi:hypothetical protein